MTHQIISSENVSMNLIGKFDPKKHRFYASQVKYYESQYLSSRSVAVACTILDDYRYYLKLAREINSGKATLAD